VAYDGTVLTIDGRPGPASAARFHYWQWPTPSAWPTVFHKLHSDGYDAVAIDLDWGYHSARPGTYDFSGIRDLDTLFEDAAREHLYVTVDSGPYSAGGADAGGIPDWLLAHTAGDATLDARYVHESHGWMKQVDAVIARHQLTNGDGTIVLDRIETGALGNVATLERAARHDGVNVPFGSLRVAHTYAGFPWGWTTAPNVYDGDYRIDAVPVTPPKGVRWRMRRDDDEIANAFEDQAWPPLIAARQFDPDADEDDDAADNSKAKHPDSTENPTSNESRSDRFFGVDDYGFHHGAVWYRGHFTASGNERTFTLSGTTGVGGALGVWLNGAYLGNSVANAGGNVRAAFPLRANVLRSGRDNLISVLFENAGHDEDPKQDSTDAAARGMFQAALVPATAIAWHVLGNGEYNIDTRRGPLADGGLAGEITGWQDPSYSDAGWQIAQLPFRTPSPGVTWYRATVPLDVPLSAGRILALQLHFAGNARYRAFVYCNGWLMAHVAANGGDRRVVPLPPGIVTNPGDNTLAVVLWTLAGNGNVNVSYATVASSNFGD
jgi:beta-galactosidase GanA